MSKEYRQHEATPEELSASEPQQEQRSLEDLTTSESQQEQDAQDNPERNDIQLTAIDAALSQLFALLTSLPDPELLSEAQKNRERKWLRDRLKALNAVPRSEWHREFEDILQIEIDSWKNGAFIEREVSIGEDAPRADFILINGETLPESTKSVFRIFRKTNAVEYKRPTDPLTEQMVWKMGGYGHLLVGTDKSTRYDTKELTLSIFAYKKNEKQFSSMMARGMLKETEEKGIYRVIGMSPLPYQVVITEELEGREYAAYRALSKHSDVRDISVILENMKDCSSDIRDRYIRILQTIAVNNTREITDIIREEFDMTDINERFYEIFKPVFLERLEPEIQERVNKKVEAATKAAEAKAAEAAAKTATETATEASFTTVAERMISNGAFGSDISCYTGYDRSRIDSIARRLNRTVNWSEARP